MSKTYSVIDASGREWTFYSIERAETFAAKNLNSIRSWR